MNEIYVNTVRLMLGIAPIIFDTPLFAMKGGTALNVNLEKLRKNNRALFEKQEASLSDGFANT